MRSPFADFQLLLHPSSQKPEVRTRLLPGQRLLGLAGITVVTVEDGVRSQPAQRLALLWQVCAVISCQVNEFG